MSTISTRSLPFGVEQYTPEEIKTHFEYPMEEEGSTAPLPSSDQDLEQFGQPHPIRSFMAKTVIAFGTLVPSERSWPIDRELIMAVYRCRENQEEVANFFEPVTFNWDEDIHIALEAARRYSEQIHADY